MRREEKGDEIGCNTRACLDMVRCADKADDEPRGGRKTNVKERLS